VSIRPVIVSAIVLVMAVAAASCGGSSSSSSGASTSAGGGGSTSALGTGGSSTGSLGGGSGFCSVATGKMRGLERKMAQIATIASQPERLKQQLDAMQSFANGAESDAPGEIKPDIAVFAGFLKHLADGYKKADYNPAAAAVVLGPYIQQQQSKLDAASKHVQAWASANCGL
jgi:hypothetical protein